ncbi:tricarboxylate transport protein [Meredithblackwellia eburnea MCA 4105]
MSVAKNHSTPAYFSLLAGASAGAVESFATYPTEFVKTTAQLGGKTAGGGVSVASIVKQTYGQQGVTGFYAGCAPVIAGNALKAGVRFVAYDAVRDALRDNNGKLTPGKTLLAGIAAGALETRLIEERRNASPGSTKLDTAQVVTKLVRQEGISGLYRGLWPTMMKQCANSAVRFSSYQGLKDLALAQRSSKELTSLQIMGIGSLAGMITVYTTMPLDVVKTRMQQAKATSTSSLDCMASILKKEGVYTFWRGSSPRVMRLLISGSISFLVYENVMKLLKSF